MNEPTTFDRAQSRTALRLLDLAAKPTSALLRRIRPLRATTFMDTARRLTGLEDFGTPDIDEPLALLADELSTSDAVTDVGELIERDMLRRLLITRLKIVDHLARHPGITDLVLDRPIFIAGLPRTGTTLLQHVLASHPEIRAIEGWEAADPLPTRSESARRRAYSRRLKAMKGVVPAAFTVHPMEPEGPEEGLDMIDRTFYAQRLAFFGPLAYGEWLNSRTTEQLVEAYRIYVDQLRMLSAQRPGRILEKSPSLLGLEHVLAHHLPDAHFVVTHRDLDDVIPSALSLSAVGRSASQRFDPAALGPDVAKGLCALVEGMLDPPAAVDQSRVVHVIYDELVADPLTVFKGLLDHLELTDPGDLSERIESVRNSLPRHKYGRHVYDLAQFGVSRDDYADLADAYAERFGLRR
jgi:hypothetical protein